MKPVVDQDTCIGCGNCLAVCPAEPNCFEVDDISTVIHPESCIDCGDCVEGCPVDAIELIE